ncbi:MAG: LptF/LptG family permease [Planctomycetota bacterium]|jgi:lipopolysaccharide export system permease protein
MHITIATEYFFYLRMAGVYGVLLVAALYLGVLLMKSLLARYMMGEVLKVFFLSFAILSGVVLFFTAVQMLHKGLLVHFIKTAHLTIFLYMPWGILQVSYLVAVTLAIGRMSADNEISVLRTSGISLPRIVGPVIAFGVILSCFSFWISSEVAPYCYASKQLLPRAFVRELNTLQSGKNKTIQFSGFKFFCREINAVEDPEKEGVQKNIFYDITLYRANVEPFEGETQHTLKQFKAGRAYLVTHPSGSLAILRMFDVRVVQVKPKFVYWKFDSCDLPFVLKRSPRIGPAATRNDEFPKILETKRKDVAEGKRKHAFFWNKKNQILNNPNLTGIQRERELRAAEEEKIKAAILWGDSWQEFHRFRSELHRRYAFAFMPLLWTLIALPIALTMTRKNRLVPMFISLLLALLVSFAPTIIGLNFGTAGAHPWTDVSGDVSKLFRIPLDEFPPAIAWAYLGTALSVILMVFLNTYLPYRMMRGATGWFSHLTNEIGTLFSMIWQIIRKAFASIAGILSGGRKREGDQERIYPEARRGIWRWLVKIRINIFDAYCTKLFIWRLIICALSFLVLFICFDLMLNLTKFFKSGQPLFAQIFRHYFVYSIAILYSLAPFILLMAAMFTVTRLNKSNEIIPLLMAGVPTRRTLMPIFIGALVFSLLMVGAEELVVPRLANSMRLAKGEAFVRPMIFPDKYDNLINMERYYPGHKKMENVQITNDSTRCQVFAENAFFSRIKLGEKKVRGWRMVNTTVYRYGAAGNLLRLPDGSYAIEDWENSFFIPCIEPEKAAGIPRQFKKLCTDIRPEDLESAAKGIHDLAHLSIVDLHMQSKRHPYLTHLNVQFWSRITFSISNLVLLLLGLPFALRFTMRSYFIGVAMSLCVCVVYVIVTYLFAELGNRGDMNPFMAAWIPVAVFGAAGTAMFDSVTT